MKRLLLASLLVSMVSTPAQAQFGRNDNPNMRNFYMARQQVQIYDETPQVNDMRTNPAAAAQAPAPAVAGPQALPRAGFSTYMSGYSGPSARQALPPASNGVQKLPPAGPNLTGQRAPSGGTIKPKVAKAPAVKAPVVAKSYKPYAKAPVNTGNSGGLLNSSTSVSGSVLHWNRRKAGY